MAKELNNVKLKRVNIDEKTKRLLVKKSIEASKNAFNPITSANTGSAVLTGSGNIYQGCNYQSTISGMGSCSERTAIYHAVIHGECNIKAIAVYFPSRQIHGPCGMCYQAIAEAAQIAQNDIVILMTNRERKFKETTVNKILPDAYGPRKAGKDLSKWESK